MPRISTKTHAAADYAAGALLLAAPGLTGARDPRARTLLRGVGAAVLGQALVTDWELAPVRRLPVRAHLAAAGACRARRHAPRVPAPARPGRARDRRVAAPGRRRPRRGRPGRAHPAGGHRRR